MGTKSSDSNPRYLSFEDYKFRRVLFLVSLGLALILTIAFLLFYALVETARGKLPLDFFLAFLSLSLSVAPLIIRLSEGEASGRNPYLQIKGDIERSEIQTRFFYDLVLWGVTAYAFFVAVG